MYLAQGHNAVTPVTYLKCIGLRSQSAGFENGYLNLSILVNKQTNTEPVRKYLQHMGNITGLQIRGWVSKLFFLCRVENIWLGFSKESSLWDGSFEHPYECRTKHPETKHPMPFFDTPDKTSHTDLPPRTKHPMQLLSPRTKHPMPFLPPRTKHPMPFLPPRTKHPTLCLKPMKVHKTPHLVNCQYH